MSNLFKNIEKNDILILDDNKIFLNLFSTTFVENGVIKVCQKYNAESYIDFTNLPYTTFYNCSSSYTEETANSIFDLSLGASANSIWITGEEGNGTFWNSGSEGDVFAKPSGSVFRCSELTQQVYQNYAFDLLGDRNAIFKLDNDKDTYENEIREALFIHFKRKIFKDQLNEPPYGLLVQFGQFFGTATSYMCKSTASSITSKEFVPLANKPEYAITIKKDKWDRKYSNIHGVYTFRKTVNLVDIITEQIIIKNIGLVYYDYGLIVLRLSNTDFSTHMIDETYPFGGILPSVNYVQSPTIPEPVPFFHYQDVLSNQYSFYECSTSGSLSPEQSYEYLIRGFIQHITGTDSVDSSDVIAFAKEKAKQSKILLKIDANEFNYSSNPTYLKPSTEIKTVVLIDNEADVYQVERLNIEEIIQNTSKTYITTVGFYNQFNQLMAVGKFNRPVPKSKDKKYIFSAKLNF